MNIFVTHPSNRECARVLDDKRVLKMTIETAQLICTTLHHYKDKVELSYIFQAHTTKQDCFDNLYKPTHVNHPCAVWARESLCNHIWLCDYLHYLLKEYTHRFDKTHKTTGIYDLLAAFDLKNTFTKVDLTPFVNCTPFKDMEDVHEAYRLCLKDKWANDKVPPKWTMRARPRWAVDVDMPLFSNMSSVAPKRRLAQDEMEIK